MSKRYTVEVIEGEDGEAILPLPEELLQEAGWEEGDELDWKDNKDGTYTLSKLSKDTAWVLVETVQTFLHRYMVEVPKDHPEYALDTVTMEEAKEFSQKHLGEQIASHRVVSYKEAMDLCRADNEYCKTWTDEQFMKSFFTKEGEKVVW